MHLDTVLDHHRAHLLGCATLADDIAVLCDSGMIRRPQGLDQPLRIGRAYPHGPFRAGEQVGEPSLGGKSSGGEDDDVVHDQLGLGQQVGGHDHDATLARRDRLLGGVIAKEVAKPRDALRVEAIGRFVEDENVRLSEQRPGELQPLAHAHREPTDLPVARFGEPDQFEALLHPGKGEARHRRDDLQVTTGGARRMEARSLEHGSHISGRTGQVAIAVAVDEDPARGRSHQAKQHPQGGRLARSVRSEESRHSTRDGVEVEVVDGDDLGSKALGQPSSLDCRHVWPGLRAAQSASARGGCRDLSSQVARTVTVLRPGMIAPTVSSEGGTGCSPG